MNWTTIIIETIIMTIAFTAMILIPLVKNPVWWIHDYPEDIQEEYFKTHERVPSEFFSKTVLIKKERPQDRFRDRKCRRSTRWRTDFR